MLLLTQSLQGWISVRREYKSQMHIFLFLALAYLGGWSSMFASPTFRWTFVEWRFFSIMMVFSAAFALTVFVLGVICRVNFGKGLPRYRAYQPHLQRSLS